jgi:hypothetical protein
MRARPADLGTGSLWSAAPEALFGFQRSRSAVFLLLSCLVAEHQLECLGAQPTRPAPGASATELSFVPPVSGPVNRVSTEQFYRAAPPRTTTLHPR